MRTGAAGFEVVRDFLDSSDANRATIWELLVQPLLDGPRPARASAEAAPATEKSTEESDSGTCELRLVLDLVLDENEDWRRKFAAKDHELRVWKLSAALGWATRPYPPLNPEKFEERQP